MSGETVYSRAADVIRERGHHRGDYEAPSGSVCVHGAIHVAEGRAPNVCRNPHTSGASGACPYDRLWPALRRRGVTGMTPAEWQDWHRTSTEDVLMVLKELHVEAGGS